MMRIMLADDKNLRIRKLARVGRRVIYLQPSDARHAYIPQDDIRMQFLRLLQNLFGIRSPAANRPVFPLRRQQRNAPADHFIVFGDENPQPIRQ